MDGTSSIRFYRTRVLTGRSTATSAHRRGAPPRRKTDASPSGADLDSKRAEELLYEKGRRTTARGVDEL